MQKGLEKFIQKYYLPDVQVRMAGIGLFTFIVLIVDHNQKCSLEVVATGVLFIRGSDMASWLAGRASFLLLHLCLYPSSQF